MKKDTQYLMWLCYELSAVLTGDATINAELPPQHDDAFEAVGKLLGLGAKSVARYSLMARKLLATEIGEREYFLWLNNREFTWFWLYHSQHAESYVAAAKGRLKDARGAKDYQAWLAVYERRPLLHQRRPLLYLPLPPDHPTAIAIDEARKAKGLRLGLTKAGRPRRRI